jgi:hypothetical protein
MYRILCPFFESYCFSGLQGKMIAIAKLRV